MEVREKISWPQRFHGIFPMYEINKSLFKHFRTRNLAPETEMVWATTAPLGTHTFTFILERVTELNETNRYSKEFLSTYFCIFKFFSYFYSTVHKNAFSIQKVSFLHCSVDKGVLKTTNYLSTCT